MSAFEQKNPSRRTALVEDAGQRRRSLQRQHRKQTIQKFVREFRKRLGLPQVIEVDGVRYTERDPTPLSRALSPRGTGKKEYLVRFADGGSRMRIRATSKRVYTDLMPDPDLQHDSSVLDRIRPGMRVLEVGAGTGGGSAALARAVGPSGGVIALGSDRESIRFARRRYQFNHLAIELGGIESLYGELDHAFDAAIVRCSPLIAAQEIREVWRCIARGGWMLLCQTDNLDQSPHTLDLPEIARLYASRPSRFLYERTQDRKPPASAGPSLDQ